jgi:S-adenosylmethionine hydrolase
VTCEGGSQPPLQKVETYAKEICGIVYYIDKFGNVYKTEDILEGQQNPAVVAKYRVDNDIYTLSDFRFT